MLKKLNPSCSRRAVSFFVEEAKEIAFLFWYLDKNCFGPTIFWKKEFGGDFRKIFYLPPAKNSNENGKKNCVKGFLGK